MNRLAVSALLAVAAHVMLAFVALDVSRRDRIPDRSHKVRMSLGYRLPPMSQPVPRVTPPVRKIEPAPQPVATEQKTVAVPAAHQPATVREKTETPVVQPVAEQEDAGPSEAALDNAAGSDISEARPLYRSNPKPAYPLQARRRGYQGTVVLDVFVDTQGSAGELRIVSSSGHAMLDDEAVRTVAGWRFEPGLKGGRPTPMWVKIPVRFQLQ